MVADPGTSPEICIEIPDVDVDLYIETSKIFWNAIFYGRSTVVPRSLHGRSTVAREIEAGRLFATGEVLVVRTMDKWLPRSSYADVDGIRMLPAAE